MTKVEERKVPKLRFKGFSQDWGTIKLGELLEFKNGINANKEKYGKGVKFINVLDIIENDVITYDKIKGFVDITQDDFEKNKVEYGDVLFQRSSEIREEVGQANVYVSNQPVTFGGFVIRGKKISDYNVFFINFILKTMVVRKDITSRSGGSTRYNIGQDSLTKIQLNIPALEEQGKIASFLTSVDNYIQNLKSQKESLEKYKKGIMQKIFSQEIRFKDENGKDFPSWKENRLGALFIEKNQRAKNNDYTLLSVGQEKGVYKQISSDKRDISSKNKSNYKVVEIGDIAYNTMRMWQASYGLSSYNGIVSPAYTVISLKSGSINFFEYLLKVPRTVFNFYRYSQGLTSDTWNLKFRHFSEVKVIFPEAEKEQLKIADFLSSIDDLIQSKEEQVEKTQEWKKGLIQQMFV